mgnify:CR=1 FL=1
MKVNLKLSEREELSLICMDLRNWYSLFPYEKDYILNRSKEIALTYADTLGADLTNKLLAAINELSITR